MLRLLTGTCLMLLLGPGPLPAVAADQCENCHADPHHYVQHRKLYSYYQDWLDSPHAASGLSCSSCHGGDPENSLYFRNQPETCGACHTNKAARFKTSKHYRALQTDTVAPTCTTCHRAMNRRPYYRDILIDACATCHNESNPDHIPLVTSQVKEYLQRLNVAKGYLGWTTLHYESLGWPGGSRCEVDEITGKFEAAVSRVHSFDLSQMDQSSSEILTELKLIFQRIWNEREKKSVTTEVTPPD